MSRNDATIYGVAVLSGAVLVFQIQPVAGKFLLPAFGGGASVWTSCMFFFQTMLLGGYAYAHWLTTCLQPRRQAALHGTLLAASMLFLPIGFAIDSFPGVDPAASIWAALLLSIGVPFVLLASTAPLLQRWSSMTGPRRSPYRLYALSNVGALAALLTYPLMIEPNLRLQMQAMAWSFGYVAFVMASIAACRKLWRQAGTTGVGEVATEADAGDAASNWTKTNAVLTILFSGAGVVMLLAATNQMTQNVPPIPFLWILPLAAYLISYIVCFSGSRWYDRPVWGSLFVVAGSCLIILEFFGTSFPILPVASAYLLVLFCTCMLCHGELYRLRPPPVRLSAYYLLIASGGALAGAFVALLAPVLFNRYWEGLAGAGLVYLLFGFVALRDTRRPGRTATVASGMQASIETWGHRLFAVGWVAGLVLFPAVVVSINGLIPSYDVASVRNFHGVLNVRDVAGDRPRRVLVDGTTIHGFQLHGDRRSEPTSYYGRNTGIGAVMRAINRDPGLQAGIVGLGAGTLAAYGEPEDRFRFYELNPAVVSLARRHFSFLEDSAAAVDVIVGDGRILLQEELDRYGSREYDLLVIDAFSSDAIPVHLLTREAHELYWSHLAPNGVLAFHVTNNYLNLAPVVADVAATFGKPAFLVTTSPDVGESSVADWVILGGHAEESGLVAGDAVAGVTARVLAPRVEARVWTDDFSNLLDTVRR